MIRSDLFPGMNVLCHERSIEDMDLVGGLASFAVGEDCRACVEQKLRFLRRAFSKRAAIFDVHGRAGLQRSQHRADRCLATSVTGV